MVMNFVCDIQSEASLPTLLSKLSGLFGAAPAGGNGLFQVPSLPRLPQAPDQDAPGPAAASTSGPAASSSQAASASGAPAEPSNGGVWRTFSDMMQVSAVRSKTYSFWH